MGPPARADLPDWLVEVPLAHRGLWGPGVPENSLAAFAAARDAGVGVELDVHLTADGVPVVVHDLDLRRVAGVDALVATTPLAVLQEHPLADGVPVPTLRQVLEVLGDTPVMVELKNSRRSAGVLEPPVAAVLDEHPAGAAARAYVASFHPGSLAWFATHRPQVLRAQTAGLGVDGRVPVPVRALLRRLGFARWSRPHVVSFDVAALPSPATRSWRARGGVVVAWTVRDARALARAGLHADNVIFEGIDPPRWPPRPDGPAS